MTSLDMNDIVLTMLLCIGLFLLFEFAFQMYSQIVSGENIEEE